MRKFGSVRIPVTVAKAGPELRRPEVRYWSLADCGISVDGAPVTGLAGLPGKLPLGLAVETGTVSDGALPPLATTEPLMKLPRYQSKPSAVLSSWFTSMNRVLMWTCGATWSSA